MRPGDARPRSRCTVAGLHDRTYANGGSVSADLSYRNDCASGPQALEQRSERPDGSCGEPRDTHEPSYERLILAIPLIEGERKRVRPKVARPAGNQQWHTGGELS